MNKKYAGKYLFPNLEKAISMRDSLKLEDCAYNGEAHGLLPEMTHAILDGDGEVITPSEATGKYQLDVLWREEIIQEFDGEDELIIVEPVKYEHPIGWGEFALDLETEGNHRSSGFLYQKHKI